MPQQPYRHNKQGLQAFPMSFCNIYWWQLSILKKQRMTWGASKFILHTLRHEIIHAKFIKCEYWLEIVSLTDGVFYRP